MNLMMIHLMTIIPNDYIHHCISSTNHPISTNLMISLMVIQWWIYWLQWLMLHIVDNPWLILVLTMLNNLWLNTFSNGQSQLLLKMVSHHEDWSAELRIPLGGWALQGPIDCQSVTATLSPLHPAATSRGLSP